VQFSFFSRSPKCLCNSLKIKEPRSKPLNFGLFLHTDLHNKQTFAAPNESLDLAQAIASLCAQEH